MIMDFNKKLGLHNSQPENNNICQKQSCCHDEEFYLLPFLLSEFYQLDLTYIFYYELKPKKRIENTRHPK